LIAPIKTQKLDLGGFKKSKEIQKPKPKKTMSDREFVLGKTDGGKIDL
jgi:hypothetical protein